jgi:hypothetical protein
LSSALRNLVNFGWCHGLESSRNTGCGKYRGDKIVKNYIKNHSVSFVSASIFGFVNNLPLRTEVVVDSCLNRSSWTRRSVIIDQIMFGRNGKRAVVVVICFGIGQSTVNLIGYFSSTNQHLGSMRLLRARVCNKGLAVKVKGYDRSSSVRSAHACKKEAREQLHGVL